jgi:hypothetical protein
VHGCLGELVLGPNIAEMHPCNEIYFDTSSSYSAPLTAGAGRIDFSGRFAESDEAFELGEVKIHRIGE